MIMDASTGAVLHAEHPDRRVYPASLTKMMTLYLVFDALESNRLSKNQALPVSADAARQPPSKLGLRRGQTITVEEVIGALVTKSANDAAVVIAEAIGGSEARFARMMTAQARKLGMTRTTFRNASGLPNRGQVSTARDMVRLAFALRRDFPQYYRLFSMRRFTYNGRNYRNHNRLLKRYDGTDGIKTGYIRASGFNVAVSVERDGHRLIGVVFGGKTAKRRDRHMARLLDRAFSELEAGNDAPVQPLPAMVAGAPPPQRPDPLGAGDASERVALAGPDDDEAGQGSAENAGEWAVQVGAFGRYEPAHAAALKAARQSPELTGLRVVVVPSKSRRGRLYRARLVGLEKDAARKTCRMLRGKKFRCLAIKHEATLSAAR